jgi:hypothetical protein
LKYSVVPPEENFRGLSYGNWACLWWNWLLCDEPDIYRGDMLFLRGNLDYKPVGKGGPVHIDPKSFLDRTGKKGVKIFENTPILIPVCITVFRIGLDLFDGRLIETEQDARLAGIRDNQESNAMWATISCNGSKPRKIVNNLQDYFVQSSLFYLKISDKSPIRKRMDIPLEAGTSTSLTVGYYILIRSLAPSTYRIRFGTNGRGAYYTDAIYDITVQGKKKLPIDQSHKYVSTWKGTPNSRHKEHSCGKDRK